jgi:hypothetical protein
MPTITAWSAEGPDTFIIETRIPDSLVPFGMTWIGITHKGAWEAAGSNWDNFMLRPIGTGAYKCEVFSVRERAVLARHAEYWDQTRIPRHERLILLPLFVKQYKSARRMQEVAPQMKELQMKEPQMRMRMKDRMRIIMRVTARETKTKRIVRRVAG